MKLTWAGLLMTLFFSAASASAATPGEFRGKIINPPRSEAKAGCIYIAGRNHMARKVDIKAAEVLYASSVPEEQRNSNPRLSLVEGAEVRVVADQVQDGDWQAKQVEILHTSDKPESQASHNSLVFSR